MPKMGNDSKDELVDSAKEELDNIIKKLCDSIRDRVTLQQKHHAETDLDCTEIERVVLEIVLSSVRTQRLYFVIRSALMGLITALVTFVVVWYLGAIDVIQAVFLGIFLFVFALVVSRLLDKQIIKLSKRIVRFLNKHERLKMFVLKKL